MGFLATTLFLVGLATLHVSSQETSCYEKVDILFIADSSGSIGDLNFQKQLEFISNLTSKFRFGTARFSVLRFDSFPSIDISFGDYQDLSSLQNAITNISYPAGGTDTAAALKLARDQAFQPARGARSGVPRVAIVSTDGQSANTTATKEEAQKLKDSGVLVLSIGVGTGFNIVELDDIATYPDDTFEVIDYDLLVSIVNDYSELVCSAVKLFQCNNEADIFFLLDSSSQIDQVSFQNQLTFVRNVSNSLKLTSNKFGVATFGASVQPVFNLRQFNSDSDLALALSTASPVQGVIDLDQVLRYVIDQAVFDSSLGGRDNATKILVLVTNGGPGSGSHAPKNTASLLRQSGINLLAVGVSSPNLTQLQELVNDKVQDVVTNLANPAVAVSRIETLTALKECKLPQTGVGKPQITCDESVDLVFIADASGSVGYLDFQKQLEFISAFIGKFSFGPAKFSVLRFDSLPNITIGFGDYQDVSSLKNAITTIDYPGGGTDTAAALKLAREQAFQTARGARAGVPRVAIVSTDGLSNNPSATKVEAESLQTSEVLVLALGVGNNYNKLELDNIGTYSSDIYEVKNYSTLVSIINDYSKLVCDVVKLFQCNNEADIIILLDSSIKIDQFSLQNLLAFVKNVSNTVNLTTNKFGLITFGASVQLVFNLKQVVNDNDLASALSAASPVQGVTDVDQVLRYVRDQAVFNSSLGGRDNATKILVVVTNGDSTSGGQAKNTASQLRQSGIHLLAVGVSSPNLAQLNGLVADPAQDVVTNLTNPAVVLNRIQTLTALNECKLPQSGVNDMKESDYCRFYNWENGIHAHPRNCTKFIQCTFLRTDVMSCPAGLGYDPDLQTCNFINQVSACYNPPPVPTPPPQLATPQPRVITNICESYRLADGNYPNPNNCQQFIMCGGYQTYSLPCPAGLNYNTANQVCDDVHVIDCQVNYHYFDNLIAG